MTTQASPNSTGFIAKYYHEKTLLSNQQLTQTDKQTTLSIHQQKQTAIASHWIKTNCHNAIPM